MSSFNTVVSMKTADIVAAYQRVTGQAPLTSKIPMAKTLSEMVDNGRITLADIQGGAAAVSPKISQDIDALAASVQSLKDRMDKSDSAIGLNLGRVAQNTSTAVAEVRAQAEMAQQETKSLRTQIQTLSESLGQIKVDPATVNAAIKVAVETAFAPLAAQAKADGKEGEVLAAAQALPAGEKTALEVFGMDLRDVKGRPLMFTVFAHAEAPAVDPAFIWTESIVRHLHIAQVNGRNVWMGGPAGTGKTQTAQQFAARTGRMFRRFVFDRFSSRDDFLGATGLKAGSTVFEMGPVLEAYTTPGAVCLLDEVGMGQPAALSALNAFLERQAAVAYADRVWHRAPGTMFLAADNSLGNGDTSGRFAGVQTMNSAFVERFSLVVPFSYLEPAVEADALVRHTGCTQALADHLARALKNLRGQAMKGNIIDAPSIRQMIAFIEACRALTPHEAWRSAISARQPAESEAALAAAFSACIDVNLIQKEIQ